MGANDYLAQPFDHDELIAKVRVQFRLRTSLMALAEANAKVQMYHTELEELVAHASR